LIPKHERHFTGFDDKVVALCAREGRYLLRSNQTETDTRR
jgi:hypothetical protein